MGKLPLSIAFRGADVQLTFNATPNDGLEPPGSIRGKGRRRCAPSWRSHRLHLSAAVMSDIT